MGTRIIRLDAIAYLCKQVGTSCINLPQTHEVVKLLRDVLDMLAPDILLLTETNVPHAQNISYFGDGDEARMVYQFSLPPLLLHALHTGSSRYLSAWAASLQDPPAGCCFLNFSASHDGIGLRPLEGLVPDDMVAAMLNTMRERGGYISTKSNSDGSESPYELNISYFDAFREVDGDNRWDGLDEANDQICQSSRECPDVRKICRRNTATGDNAFFNCGAGGVERVLDALKLLAAEGIGALGFDTAFGGGGEPGGSVAAFETLAAADVVCRGIVPALELLIHPLRLTATLRS